MTLVVSKIIDGVLHNISDSLITDKDNFEHTYKPNKDLFTSILKTAILHRRLCISYAGTVKIADDCLNAIINKNSYTAYWVTEYIKKLTQNLNNETQFVVCFIEDDGSIRQWKIVNGQLQNFTDSLLCIGDPKAIKVFEEKLNELILSGTKESLAMTRAFNFTLNDDSIESVGHFPISVKSGKRSLSNGKSSHNEIVFNYCEMMVSVLKHDVTFKTKPGEFVDVPINPDEDLTGMSIFVTECVSKFGVAIYSLSHKKGLLFCPKLDLKRIVFKTVKGETLESTYQNFIDDIYEKYQLPMRGLIWPSGAFGFKIIQNFDYNSFQKESKK